MAILSESWDPIAHTLGYKHEVAMLLDLYVVQHLSMEEMARKLGYSKGNIRKRLTIMGVTIKGRGGPNNPTGALDGATDEELKAPKECAKKFGVALTTVYKERERRTKECNSALLPPPPSNGLSDIKGDISHSPNGSDEMQSIESTTKSASLKEI
jgi:hypothetical protein